MHSYHYPAEITHTSFLWSSSLDGVAGVKGWGRVERAGGGGVREWGIEGGVSGGGGEGGEREERFLNV